MPHRLLVVFFAPTLAVLPASSWKESAVAHWCVDPTPRFSYLAGETITQRFLKQSFPNPRIIDSAMGFDDGLCFHFMKKTPAPDFDDREGDGVDEDAFEALFSQIEEDLKKDETFSGDVDDEITDDDLARLERELEEALSDEESHDFLEDLPSKSDNPDDYDEEEQLSPNLKNWQLRRLAHALKIGRRKTSIKNLSAELGLERRYVLELFREPPPNLLIMCASLPNEVTQKSESVSEPVAVVSDVSNSQNEPKAEVPVYVRQTRWSMQKRLKKVQLLTLERVYARTKRPTNAMISSIVHVTNLPWKRVVKWFEDKRFEDGVPDHRQPFRRPKQEAISRSTIFSD